MSWECRFCGSIFEKKYCLAIHQKTAKYCLALRGEHTPFKCPVCEKEFTEKRNMDNHVKKCNLNDKISRIDANFSLFYKEFKKSINSKIMVDKALSPLIVAKTMRTILARVCLEQKQETIKF